MMMVPHGAPAPQVQPPSPSRHGLSSRFLQTQLMSSQREHLGIGFKTILLQTAARQGYGVRKENPAFNRYDWFLT
jgi:hypothetical protein